MNSLNVDEAIKNSALQAQGRGAKLPLCPTSGAPCRSQAHTQTLLGASVPSCRYGQPLYSSSIPPPGNLMRGDYNTENLATHSKRTFHPLYYCYPHSDKHSHPSEEGKDKGLKVKRILGSEQAHTLQGIRHSRHQVCTEILDLQLLSSRHFHVSSFCFLKKKNGQDMPAGTVIGSNHIAL